MGEGWIGGQSEWWKEERRGREMGRLVGDGWVRGGWGSGGRVEGGRASQLCAGRRTVRVWSASGSRYTRLHTLYPVPLLLSPPPPLTPLHISHHTTVASTTSTPLTPLHNSIRSTSLHHHSSTLVVPHYRYLHFKRVPSPPLPLHYLCFHCLHIVAFVSPPYSSYLTYPLHLPFLHIAVSAPHLPLHHRCFHSLHIIASTSQQYSLYLLH